MLKLAWKNLRQDLRRTGLSIGGVSAAVLLILALQGVFAGSAKQITSYIDESKADVILAQAGVKNMHMANSVIPLALQQKIQGVTGVRKVVPIAYFPGKMEVAGDKVLVYIIGFDVKDKEGIGGPWRIAAGSRLPGPGEVIIPENAAKSWGLEIGDQLQITGRWFKIGGLSKETEILTNSYVFMSLEDASSLIYQKETINYFLVTALNPEESQDLAQRIMENVSGVSALSRSDFAESDRQITVQMGLNVIKAMSVAALAIGLMVIMLTLYASTVEKSREYGILKAVGANNSRLFEVVLIQALFITIAGFAGGLLLAWGVSGLVAVYLPKVKILLEAPAIGQAFLSVLGIGLVATLLPTWGITRVDPVVVFKS